MLTGDGGKEWHRASSPLIFFSSPVFLVGVMNVSILTVHDGGAPPLRYSREGFEQIDDRDFNNLQRLYGPDSTWKMITCLVTT